tara:strand:+ start:616 stop:756 length:141 start_codon:yes stop_codon:yes gene_type:complete
LIDEVLNDIEQYNGAYLDWKKADNDFNLIITINLFDIIFGPTRYVG